ncbi:MAG: DNA polymerase III subunit gamma/tau, partial [Myxococcota bacterium]
MSYLAIARKYRPATFDEIVGQEHVTRTLRNAIHNDRIHHAYLFTGARGVGKTTAARALSRALNCEKGPTDTPCGTCTSCVEVANGSSPDLVEIDGASNNSVEDMREIREAVQYAPTRGKWKIYLVDEVHMLSKGAFNALLKTLEEPPPHVIFIFATTEPNKIPDTILSRVQRFDFKRIPGPKVAEHLAAIAEKEGVTISPNGLRLLARAGEGSMRDSQSLLDQLIAYGEGDIGDDQVAETLGLIDRGALHNFLAAMLAGEPAKCLGIIDHVYGYGHELSVFTQDLLEVLRDATFLGLSKDAAQYVDLPDDERDTLIQIVDGVPAERLSRLFSALMDVHAQVKRAGRPRIVLEMAVARLATTRDAEPVAALLGRLERVERNLRGGGGPPSGGNGGSRRPSSGGRPGGHPRGGPGPRASARPPETASRPHRNDSPSATIAPPAAPRPQASSQRPPAAPQPPMEPAGRFAEPPPREDAPLVDDGGWGALSVEQSDLGQLANKTRAKGTVKHRIAAKSAVPADPWRRFVAAIKAAGPRYGAFTRGQPVIHEGSLRLIMRRGRDKAEGDLLLDDPIVQKALADAYPGLTMVLEETKSTGASSADLERDFLADPKLRRIVQVLGA